MPSNVWIFEDETPTQRAVERIFKRVLGRAIGPLFSTTVTHVPTMIGEPAGEPLRAKDLCRPSVVAIVVDLRMDAGDGPHASVEEAHKCIACRENYRGFHVLSLAEQSNCLQKTFVASAWVANLPRALQEDLERMRGKGLSLFSKDDWEELAAKVYAAFDLARIGYSTDVATRESLFLVGRRVLSDKIEPVLILGDSGTGKEEAARHIHRVGRLLLKNQQRRYTDDVVVVHCGGLTSDLARDELFGHVQGAYTGASVHTAGRLLRAVGCLPAHQTRGRDGVKAEAAAIAKRLREVETAFVAVNANITASVVEATTQLAELARAVSQLGVEWNELRQDIIDGATGGGSAWRQYREWLFTTHLFEKLDNGIDLRIKPDAPFGTVFLDEFGELQASVQALLLRALETGEIEPLGFPGTIHLRDRDNRLHVRFIGATNRSSVRRLVTGGVGRAPTARHEEHPPNDESETSEVRADLVYRLAQWVVELPRVSSSEVPDLITREKNERPDLRDVKWQPDAVAKLSGLVQDGVFEGNRRQLRTVAMRAMAYARELPAMGSGPQQELTVTPAIVEWAVRPIRPRTQRDVGTADREMRLRRAVGRMLRNDYGWPHESDDVTWKSVRTVLKDKRRLCHAFLTASLFGISGGSEVELAELEQAFGAKRGEDSVIRKHLRPIALDVLASDFDVPQKKLDWSAALAEIRKRFSEKREYL